MGVRSLSFEWLTCRMNLVDAGNDSEIILHNSQQMKMMQANE